MPSSLISDLSQGGRAFARLMAAIEQHSYHMVYRTGLQALARVLNMTCLLLGPARFAEASGIDKVVYRQCGTIDADRVGDAMRAGAAAVRHLETSPRHQPGMAQA